MRVGLALGGGLARGLFHVGVFKALEKLKIKVDSIAGTSMGAVMGGLYALYGDSASVESIVFKTLDVYKKDIAILKNHFTLPQKEAENAFLDSCLRFAKEFRLWHLRFVKSELVSVKPFIEIFKFMFNDFNFQDCKINFIATSVDILTGTIVPLKEGPLYRAILASSILPGFFPPFKWEDKLLVDGAVLAPLPTLELATQADFILSINLEDYSLLNPQIKNAIDVLCITDNIRYKKILEDNLKDADFVISPDLKGFSLGDFDKAGELVERGESETLKKQDELLRAFKSARFLKFFFASHRKPYL